MGVFSAHIYVESHAVCRRSQYLMIYIVVEGIVDQINQSLARRRAARAAAEAED